MSVTLWIRHIQDQTSQCARMDLGGAHEVPLLAEELLIGRESQFFRDGGPELL